MLISRFFSPLRSSNAGPFRNLFKFSSENRPRDLTKTAAEAETQPTQKSTYRYDPVKFDQVNNEAFIKKIEEIERFNKFGDKRKADGYKLPIFLTLTAAFLYHLWLTCPYNVVYKHATINEYIPQRNYVHSIFLSPLSFQNFGQLIIYGPLMVYSFAVLGKYLKQRQMALLYLTNCLVSYGATYYYEKHYKGVKLMKPKATGGTTPLCFISTYLMMNPTHLMFGSKFLPFFVIPFAYYIYEANEYQQNPDREISSEAHAASISYGLLVGLFLKLLITKGKL